MNTDELSTKNETEALNKHNVVCSADMKKKLNNLGIYVEKIGSEIHIGLNGNACLTVSADNFHQAFDAFKLKIQNAVNYKRSVESSGYKLPYS